MAYVVYYKSGPLARAAAIATAAGSRYREWSLEADVYAHYVCTIL